MSVFPVFLKLAGRRVLVVGGGPVAAGKLRALLEADAAVTVVAPDVVDEIAVQWLPPEGGSSDSPWLPPEGGSSDSPWLPPSGGSSDSPWLPSSGGSSDSPWLPPSGGRSDSPWLPPSGGRSESGGRLEILRKPFEPADLDGVCFVVAAAPPDVNRAVASAAHARGIFVNAVDDVENASAYAGAVVRRAGVTIALSTDGAAPALAGLVREGLEALLPDDLDDWMTCAREARRRWLAARVPMAQRRPLLLDALVALYDGRAAAAAGEAR